MPGPAVAASGSVLVHQEAAARVPVAQAEGRCYREVSLIHVGRREVVLGPGRGRGMGPQPAPAGCKRSQGHGRDA
jgi:hypothetical protein